MAYKPTGRPLGRPKTKDAPDRTISLKIPPDLLTRVQHYASLHQQSMSELIRDGLEWRITEGDPRWQPLPDARHYSISVIPELGQSVHLFNDHRPVDEDLAPGVLGEAQEQTNGITIIPTTLAAATALHLQPTDAPRQPETVRPPFDTNIYTLGRLCENGHDYQGTGQTLRSRKRRVCQACDKANARERRHAKRLAQTTG
jgi:hypothetical protein